jgi:signal peptide peptidase SppA
MVKMTQILKDKTILAFLTDTIWAMEYNVLSRMADVIGRHASDIKLSADEIKAATGREEKEERLLYRENGNVAVVPITGVMAKHSSQVNGISQAQGSSAEQISKDLDRAVANSRIERIVLAVESPGGSVGGAFDLAKKIYEINKIKPITAFVDDIADSAAYLQVSQADKIFVSRNAEVGSIGVYTVLLDSSAYEEKLGFKYKILKSGKYKGAGTEGLPLKDDELGDLQNRINSIHKLFVADVARGRNLNIEDVAKIADGRVFSPDEAMELGLIDGISTLQDVIENKSAVVRDNKLVPTAAAINDNELNGDTKMADVKLTAEEIEKQKNDAVAAAVTAENTRIQSVTKVLAGHTDLIAAAVADRTCDATKATAMLLPAVQAQNAKLTEDLATANKKLEAIAAAGNPPVKVESTDALGTDRKPAETNAAAGTDDGKKETYMAKVQQLVKDGEKAGVKKGDAMMTAAKEMPKSHQAWIDGGQPEIK